MRTGLNCATVINHGDPSPDDGTPHDDPKMINLRVNKEESKHGVEEKPY